MRRFGWKEYLVFIWSNLLLESRLLPVLDQVRCGFVLVSSPRNGDYSPSCLGIAFFNVSCLSQCINISNIWSEHAKKEKSAITSSKDCAKLLRLHEIQIFY